MPPAAYIFIPCAPEIPVAVGPGPVIIIVVGVTVGYVRGRRAPRRQGYMLHRKHVLQGEPAPFDQERRRRIDAQLQFFGHRGVVVMHDHHDDECVLLLDLLDVGHGIVAKGAAQQGELAAFELVDQFSGAGLGLYGQAVLGCQAVVVDVHFKGFGRQARVFHFKGLQGVGGRPDGERARQDRQDVGNGKIGVDLPLDVGVYEVRVDLRQGGRHGVVERVEDIGASRRFMIEHFHQEVIAEFVGEVFQQGRHAIAMALCVPFSSFLHALERGILVAVADG